MALFTWLEGTSLAIWVGESLWGYPLMLSLHVVGLAIVVGLFAMRDLRLLGRIDGVSFGGLAGLAKLGWLGLLINALSGVALFSSQATTFIVSAPFLIKIASILVAATCAAFIQVRLRNNAASWDAGDGSLPVSIRTAAGLSLSCWAGAIVSGRLIAYL